MSRSYRDRHQQPRRHVDDRKRYQQQQVVFVPELREEVAVHPLDAFHVQVVREQLHFEEHEHQLHVQVHEACKRELQAGPEVDERPSLEPRVPSHVRLRDYSRRPDEHDSELCNNYEVDDVLVQPGQHDEVEDYQQTEKRVDDREEVSYVLGHGRLRVPGI